MSSSSKAGTIKAVIFDLIGTCTDWYNSAIVPALRNAPGIDVLPQEAIEELAKEWRSGFFREIQARFEAGQPLEDIDITHRRVLDALLLEKGITTQQWDENERQTLVHAWHDQQQWPDMELAMRRLKEKYFVVVLANGSTRLQLDLLKSSGLSFHAVFSSQLLGQTKPDPAMYERALDLFQIKPEEAFMVASHAYDLRAAKRVGMRTAYIQRTTEDPHEDMAQVQKEVDVFVDGRRFQVERESGMIEVAKLILDSKS